MLYTSGGLDVGRDFGESLSETEFKSRLLKLNPCLRFIKADEVGQWHPYVHSRMGVYYNDTHVCSMERTLAPEFNLWAVVKDKSGVKRKSHVEKIGWRHTVTTLVNRNVPGFTWDRVGRLFPDPQKSCGGQSEGIAPSRIYT